MYMMFVNSQVSNYYLEQSRATYTGVHYYFCTPNIKSCRLDNVEGLSHMVNARRKHKKGIYFYRCPLRNYKCVIEICCLRYLDQVSI